MKLSDHSNSSTARLYRWWPGVLLVVLTLAAYGPVWRAGFIWDDDAYVTLNPLMTAHDGLWRIWFSTDSPSQYFPLTFTTFYFERALWGLNPMGYHVVNVLLQAANALLLWRLLAALRIPGAWLAAGLFALHPVQVESVAWITERKNLLMGFFFLLTLWEWREFVDEKEGRPVWRHYALALIFCGLSLSAKTTACTLPAALLLMLWLEKRRIDWRRLAQIAPFVAMGIGMGLLTIWWERHHQHTEGRVFQMSLLERLLVASRAVWFYAGKLLWPVDLTFSYPRWKISVSDPGAYVWVAATVALGVVIWRMRRWTGRSVEVAAAYFVATLSPMLGFIMLFTFLYSFVADHYQYMACIGPLALAAAGIDTMLSHLGRQKKFLQPAIYAALLLTLGTLTWRQCQTYTSQETLWRATIDRNPESWMAENDLGVILYDKGQTDEAIHLFQKSLAVRPDDGEAHNNLGAALDKTGKMDDAIVEFQKALEIRPDYAEAHRNLGDALLREGKLDEAIFHFHRAVELRPDIARAHRNLGGALLRKGQVDQAIAEFFAALQLHPQDSQSHYDLGVLLLQHGHTDEAIAQFQDAVTLKPDFAEAHNNLGYSLLEKGLGDEAIGQLRRALQLRPDYAPAHYNLGNALLKAGKADQAITEFQELLVLQPEAPQAHNNLGNALLRKGLVDQAILQYQTALALKPAFVESRKNLAGIAWRMATSTNALSRNGTKAVELAGQLDKVSHGNDPAMAAVLAAAEAEAGRLDQAIAAARRSLQLASGHENAAMVSAIQSQLKCYEAGQPFRDSR